MLRPRPLATVIAALALLAGALIFAPIAATRSGVPTLSLTPPVALAPASPSPSPSPTTGTGTTTTFGPPHQLPKTGLDAWLVVVLGLGLVTAGATLRRALSGLASRGGG